MFRGSPDSVTWIKGSAQTLACQVLEKPSAQCADRCLPSVLGQPTTALRSVQRGRPEALGDSPQQAWGHWGMGGHSKYNFPGGLSSKDVFPHGPRAGAVSPPSLLGLWVAILPSGSQAPSPIRNQSPWTWATMVLICSDRKLWWPRGGNATWPQEQLPRGGRNFWG